jgi:hypothetical protein
MKIMDTHEIQGNLDNDNLTFVVRTKTEAITDNESIIKNMCSNIKNMCSKLGAEWYKMRDAIIFSIQKENLALEFKCYPAEGYLLLRAQWHSRKGIGTILESVPFKIGIISTGRIETFIQKTLLPYFGEEETKRMKLIAKQRREQSRVTRQGKSIYRKSIQQLYRIINNITYKKKYECCGCVPPDLPFSECLDEKFITRFQKRYFFLKALLEKSQKEIDSRIPKSATLKSHVWEAFRGASVFDASGEAFVTDISGRNWHVVGHRHEGSIYGTDKQGYIEYIPLNF